MRGGGLEKTAGKGAEGWTNGASRGGRLEDGAAAGRMEEAVVRSRTQDESTVMGETDRIG